MVLAMRWVRRPDVDGWSSFWGAVLWCEAQRGSVYLHKYLAEPTLYGEARRNKVSYYGMQVAAAILCLFYLFRKIMRYLSQYSWR